METSSNGLTSGDVGFAGRSEGSRAALYDDTGGSEPDGVTSTCFGVVGCAANDVPTSKV